MAARSQFSVITGGPGTGKTFSVVRLLALLQGAALDQGQALRIELAAPTGKAAARLTEAIGNAIAATQLPEPLVQALPQKASTMHRLLGARPGTRHLRFNRKNPLQADLVIVDEASMIDLEMMAALLEALPNRTRLVLLGDKDQLASVEAGAVLGSLCAANTGNGFSPATAQWLTEVTGEPLVATAATTSALAQQVVMLTESRRFTAHSGIGELARAVNAGSPDRLQRLWTTPTPYPDIAKLQVQAPTDSLLRSLVLDGGSANFPPHTTTAPNSGPHGYRHYLTVLREQRPIDPADRVARDEWARGVLAAFDQFRVLCALRAGPWGVEGLNAVIAQQLHTAQLIEKTTDWYEGRPVLVTRNDYALGLMNGDIGVTLRLPDDSNPPQAEYSGGLRVVFLQPDGSLKFVLPSRLTDIETVYAMTVHKSQGSEFTHVALVLPDTLSQVLTRELVYTGITRAKQWCSVVLSDESVLAQAVTRKVRRSGRLALIL